MLTSWQSYTLVAKLAVETQFAATFAWSTAVTLKRVASFSTDWYVTQIASPSWERKSYRKKNIHFVLLRRVSYEFHSSLSLLISLFFFFTW